MAHPSPEEHEDSPLPERVSIWGRAQSIATSVAIPLAILGGIAFIGGGVIYVAEAELQDFALIVMVVGGGLLLVSLLASFVSVRAALTDTRGRYATNAMAILLLFFAIAVLVNFISFQNPERADTTFTQHFSLSPQTVQVLEGLENEVRATGFFVDVRRDQVALKQQADDLLSEFQRRSNRRFTYRFYDPEEEPAQASRYQVSRYPTIVFEELGTDNQFQLGLPPLSEQDLTSALLILTGEKRKKVYFLTGHGEKDLLDTDTRSTTGYRLMAEGILRENYQLEPLNLSQERATNWQDDVAVLIIAGPQRELFSDEYEQLDAWLRGGGRALFLLDPSTPASVRRLLEPFGLELTKQVIVDEGSSVTGDPRTPLLQRPSYTFRSFGGASTTDGTARGNPSKITDNLDVTFFPEATPINLIPEYIEDARRIPPWIQYYPLAFSSGASWATEDGERNNFLEDVDFLGPHAIALALDAFCPVDSEECEQFAATPGGTLPEKTSIVVFGDSDFASNRYFPAYFNSDFLLNSVNWLAEEYELIAIHAKPFTFRELVVTRRELNFMRYASWFFLPVSVGFLGLVAWWRRR